MVLCLSLCLLTGGLLTGGLLTCGLLKRGLCLCLLLVVCVCVCWFVLCVCIFLALSGFLACCFACICHWAVENAKILGMDVKPVGNEGKLIESSFSSCTT